MLTVSEKMKQHLLSHPSAYRLDSIIGHDWNAEQRLAFQILSSTMPDGATIRDLVAATQADTALKAGFRSDTVGAFGPMRAALLDLGETQLGRPLFESVGTARPVDKTTKAVTSCTECNLQVSFPATSWRDVKERPRVCRNNHVFLTGHYSLV
jgi:hypothetical protein